MDTLDTPSAVSGSLERLADFLEVDAATMHAHVFTARYVHPGARDDVVESVKRTERLVVLDDSKSINSPGYELLDVVARAVPTSRRTFLGRQEVEFG